MELSQRMSQFLQYSRLSIPKFATKVGFKTPQTIRDILNGNTKSISDAVTFRLTTAYPELNIDWLKTGEGEMLRDEPTAYTQHIVGSHATGNQARVINTTADAAIITRLLDELTATREMYNKITDRLDDITRLLTQLSPCAKS